MGDVLGCILHFKDGLEELRFHLALPCLGPKFLGGDLEDMRAIGAVPGEKGRVSWCWESIHRV